MTREQGTARTIALTIALGFGCSGDDGVTSPSEGTATASDATSDGTSAATMDTTEGGTTVEGTDGTESSGPASTSTTTTTAETTTTTGATTTSTSSTSSTTDDPGVCGDGIVQAGELCDDGNLDDTDACVAGCKKASCGDGFVHVGAETCDDGNKINDDSCTNSCALASCGDGLQQPGEGCDDGNLEGGDGCSEACTLEICGDGILAMGEQCDDGNTLDGDGCNATCDLEKCGDGALQPGEECDDGNDVNTDACTNACTLATCGDAIVQPQLGEQCDDGDDDPGDGCNACKLPECGNGIVELGEQCDDGDEIETNTCLGTCTYNPCGVGSKIVPSDLKADHAFGRDVAVSGDTMAVSAPGYDGPLYKNQGCVYVCEKIAGQWVQVIKLTPSVLPDSYFGRNVALDGDRLVASTSRLGSIDSIYVYERVGGVWPTKETAKLTASDAASDDNFAFSVDISGDFIVAGSVKDDDGGYNSGAAYLFHRQGGAWPATETLKLHASDPIPDDWFGYAVAIDGDVLVVGSPYHDEGPGSGALYVYERQGGIWPATETVKLKVVDGDWLGRSVAISGTTIAAGAPLNSWDGIYVFEKEGGVWNVVQKLMSSDPAAQFPSDVAISGDIIVGGADDDSQKGADAGAAYVYTRQGGIWGQTNKLLAPDGAAYDGFGRAVTISGALIVVGATGNDDKGNASGSAYRLTP